jgi:ABC-type multidrug transport system fused ATPase/permease subunit
VFYAIGRAALGGHIGLGQVAVYATAAVGMGSLVYGGDTETLIRQGAPVLQRALRLQRTFPKPDAPHRSVDLHAPHIRFEQVAFTYPSSARPVLAGLDLDIPAGRSLAIVGENGAGKTTLIKLLTRLRDQTGGRITVNGEDLRDVDAAEWRARVAVIFQDFVRYELSLRENVAFGAPALLADDDALAGALADAGGTSLLTDVGWDTVLSRAYEGGADLSGGQWQKVALARALAAVRGGAEVLVLDEPTANLDVRAEAELFDRLLVITRGLTTVLISHRFSSVRRADRICVIEDGHVVEQGSHDELMTAGGRYATMFSLQASRFLDSTDE